MVRSGKGAGSRRLDPCNDELRRPEVHRGCPVCPVPQGSPAAWQPSRTAGPRLQRACQRLKSQAARAFSRTAWCSATGWSCSFETDALTLER